MNSKKDHPEKPNYDDVNEVLWSRRCMNYQYSSESGLDGQDEENSYRVTGRLPGETNPGIVEGLENAPKTFLEKGS